MLLYVAKGRLGNQLFQYAFLKTVSHKLKQKVLSFGFDEIVEVFDGVDISVIKNPFYLLKDIPKWRTFYWKINYRFYQIRDILNLLADKKIITCVEYGDQQEGSARYTDQKHCTSENEKHKKLEVGKWEVKNGIIKKFIFVKPGYFQSEKFFSPDLLSIKIKQKFISEAQKFIQAQIPKNAYKVFVHIRLGDYKNFRIFDKEVIPPLSYYNNLIKWFEENRKNCFFIILTDEPDEAGNLFFNIKNKVISKNHPGVDIAIMSLCEGGILSPSSFSWWGAYFMKKRDIVFAPKYWTGWKSKIEYPPGCFPSFAEEVEIE